MDVRFLYLIGQLGGGGAERQLYNLLKHSQRERFKPAVCVWNYAEDNGDAPPRWTIGGPGGMLRQPRGVTLDPRNKTLLVSDKYLNAVISYYFPEVF